MRANGSRRCHCLFWGCLLRPARGWSPWFSTDPGRLRRYASSHLSFVSDEINKKIEKSKFEIL
eukprot:scaffold4860_cov171-Amphora_coffeaeformis.AAC.13